MSSRNGKSIEGHEKSSSLIIQPDQASALFTIGLKSHQNGTQSLPKFSSLPMIGRLFKSKAKVAAKTKLLGFFLVETIKSPTHSSSPPPTSHQQNQES